MNRHNVKVLQQYNIFKDRVLGKGTFGCVFEGEDTKNNIPVAIKMIPLEKFKKQPEKIIPSLKNEIKNMQLLHHKNIVQLYNVIKTENNLYIIVEYCNAGSLESVIKQKNRSEVMCLNIMCQIIEGFKCLYKNNIVHRDLKPENILLHDCTVKIADFGFSKVVEAGMDEPTLYSFVGTPLYMSPQVLQKQNYSSKTDIWSLGMIFYELIYCKRAWEGKGYFILLENILNKPLQFPSLPRVHEQTKQIISRMLQLREEDRIGWEELFQYFSLDFLRSIYSDFPQAQQSQTQSQSQQNQQSSTQSQQLNNAKDQQFQQQNLPLLNTRQIQLQQLYDSNSTTKNMISPSSPSSVVSMKSERIEEEDKLSDFRQHVDTNLGRMDEESNGLSKQQQFQTQQQQQQQVSFNTTLSTEQTNSTTDEDEQVNDSQMGKLLEYFNQTLNYSQHLQLVISLQQLINKNRGQKLTMTQVKQIMMEQLQIQQQSIPQHFFGDRRFSLGQPLPQNLGTQNQQQSPQLSPQEYNQSRNQDQSIQQTKQNDWSSQKQAQIITKSQVQTEYPELGTAKKGELKNYNLDDID